MQYHRAIHQTASSSCSETKCGNPDLLISVSVLVHAHVHVYLHNGRVFCMCVGSSSARLQCFFSSIIHSLQRGGCGNMAPSAHSFWFGGCVFAWPGTGGRLFVQCCSFLSWFLLARQDARGHHSEISAPPPRWQQECCTEGFGTAARSSRVWQQGSSSPAYSLPLPNRCSEDGGAYTDGSLPVIQTFMICVH